MCFPKASCLRRLRASKVTALVSHALDEGPVKSAGEYQRRKALGLILSASDRKEAEAIAAEIKSKGGSEARWNAADRTPAISALVGTLVTGNRHTPANQLEQFYRFGEMERPLPRGGKIWLRPKKSAAA